MFLSEFAFFCPGLIYSLSHTCGAFETQNFHVKHIATENPVIKMKLRLLSRRIQSKSGRLRSSALRH